MLHLSIHAGPLKGISRYNRTDWLDIGYASMGSFVDYKIELFTIGEGISPPLTLQSYPRWSASLWDLVARAIALAHSNPSAPVERLDAPEYVKKRYAFADEITAVLQYLPTRGTGVRQVGLLEVKRHKKARGVYQATLQEDLGTSLSALPFVFRPRRLRSAELVCRAAVAALTGRIDALPPRPSLMQPKPLLIKGAPYVAIHRLREPAKTGLLRWLHEQGQSPEQIEGASQGAVPEKVFLNFLEKAL